MQYSEDKKNSYFKWQPMVLVMVLVFGILIGDWIGGTSGEVILKEKVIRPKMSSDKVSDVLRYIEAQYVDTVNIERLSDLAIERIMEELDPHSYYIDRDEVADLNEKTEGDFEGIGIEFLLIDDTISVIRAIEGGPSEASGIRAGDQIIRAGNIDMTSGLSLDSIRSIVKGPAGTELTIEVKRKISDTTLTFQVKRDRIPYHSVIHSFRIDSHTVYVKLAHFNGNAYREFVQAMEEHVKNESIERLVVDLRDNPGGYLQEVVKILNQIFNEKEKLLVYTKGRDSKKVEYETTGMNFYHVGKVAIFINESSASASEIMAGAIQDWERGMVVGRRSYGKGLVQEQFELSDGSAIRLTTAKYHTPSGRMIQRPYGNGDYENYLERRLEAGEFYVLDSIRDVDSITFKTKKGNTLYTSKGIIPDVFVPKDSIEFNPFIKLSFRHLSEFIYKDVLQAKVRGDLPDDAATWYHNFELKEDTWNKWLGFLEKKNVDREMELSQLDEIRETFADTYRFYFVYYAYSIGDAIELEFPKDPYWKALQSQWELEGKITEGRH